MDSPQTANLKRKRALAVSIKSGMPEMPQNEKRLIEKYKELKDVGYEVLEEIEKLQNDYAEGRAIVVNEAVSTKLKLKENCLEIEAVRFSFSRKVRAAGLVTKEWVSVPLSGAVSYTSWTEYKRPLRQQHSMHAKINVTVATKVATKGRTTGIITETTETSSTQHSILAPIGSFQAAEKAGARQAEFQALKTMEMTVLPGIASVGGDKGQRGKSRQPQQRLSYAAVSSKDWTNRLRPKRSLQTRCRVSGEPRGDTKKCN